MEEGVSKLAKFPLLGKERVRVRFSIQGCDAFFLASATSPRPSPL